MRITSYNDNGIVIQQPGKGKKTRWICTNFNKQFEVIPCYWTQNNPPYEVDFLIQRVNDIFPIEVKSTANTTSKSLKKFKERFPD